MHPIARSAAPALCVALALFPAPLVAEETAIPAADEPALGTTPVVVLTRAEIEAFGVPFIGEVLQRLPEQYGGTSTQGDDGDGSVHLNLRGLGIERTLILVNGRRFVSGGVGGNEHVDLNAIPTQAIERVEVWKGASAAHGSGAIGGVVNLVTRRTFNGFDFGGFGGTSQRLDGHTFDVHGTGGGQAGAWSGILSVGFSSRQAVSAMDRAFSARDSLYDFNARTIMPTGSSATPAGRVFGSGVGNAEWQALRARFPASRAFTFDAETGQWRPFDGTRLEEAGGDLYNYMERRNVLMPLWRFNAFGNGSLHLGAGVNVFVEGSYVNRRSSQNLGPSPLFTITEGFAVAPDNAFNPFGLRLTDVRRRLVEFGDRMLHQDVDTYRVVGGFEGGFHLGGPWTWSAAVNFGRTDETESRPPIFHRARMEAALGPSFVDADGRLRCGTPGAPINGCVPLNLLGGEGTITEAMRTGLTVRFDQEQFHQQLVASAVLAGQPFTLSGASAPVAIRFGGEHRRESGALTPVVADPEFRQFAGPEISGGYGTTDGFVAIDAPVLRRFGADAQGDLLALDIAARVAQRVPDSSPGPLDSPTGSTQLAYELGARVSPWDDVAIRGRFATAYREPLIAELFLPAGESAVQGSDPCAADIGATTRQQGTRIDAQCDAQGVPDDHSDDRAHLRARVGGNPRLRAETARLFSVGVALRPRWARDVTLEADYHGIDVADVIQRVGGEEILASCYPSEPGVTPSFCDRIIRDANSRILHIEDQLANVGGERASSVDLALRWEPSTPAGKFGVSARATWLSSRQLVSPRGDVLEVGGTYDLGIALPDWKADLGARWALGAWSAGAQLRWVSAFRECDFQCRVEPGAPQAPFRDIAAHATLDLSVTYELRTARGATAFRAGVMNALDAAPPFVASAFIFRSDPTTYDFMGRFFFLRVTHALR